MSWSSFKRRTAYGLRLWWLSRKLARLDEPFLFPEQRRLSHLEIGRLGEDLAARFLQRKGLKLLRRNYEGGDGGEADLVLRDRQALVFVEVKTRTQQPRTRRPRDAVTREKRHYVRRASFAWRKMLPSRRCCYRYDILEVLLIHGQQPQLTWLVDAFQDHG